jgi:hypothetical protein
MQNVPLSQKLHDFYLDSPKHVPRFCQKSMDSLIITCSRHIWKTAEGFISQKGTQYTVQMIERESGPVLASTDGLAQALIQLFASITSVQGQISSQLFD